MPPDRAILFDVMGWQDKGDASTGDNLCRLCLTVDSGITWPFLFLAETETRFRFLGLITMAAGGAHGGGDGMGG